MKVAVLNINGQETGRTVELNDQVFAYESEGTKNPAHTLYLDIKQYLGNQRQGTHKSKERSEVSGSTRKLGRQKGGGGARHGDINSPLLRGGGTVFGPRPRDYRTKLNRKMKQLARRINFPVYETTGHNRLEFPELVGHHAVIDGNMKFEYGPLTQAMKYGGIFLLNEVDLLSPDAMAGMNSILDGSPLCIAENGGEVVKPHPLFRFVATANSNGTGDETGLYQGVLRMNAAAADRFFMVKADYMAESSELAMLRKACPQLSDEEVAQLTSFAQAVRKLFAGDGDDTHVAQLSITMSTRTLLRWGLFMQVLKESAGNVNYNFCKQALNHTFAYKASSSDRVAIDEIYQRIFG